MTRQQKIENIIKATNAALDEMEKAGTLTDEARLAAIDNMNHILCLIEED